MKNATIEQVEAELKRIAELRKEMEEYKESSLKEALLLSCEMCEEIWKRQLNKLKGIHKSFVKKETPEALTRAQLEELAFDVHSTDAQAKEALMRLISERNLN